MATNPINPFTSTVNPFKAIQSGNRSLVAKYLAAKDMAQYQQLQYKKTDAEIKITSFGTLMSNFSIMNDNIGRVMKSITGVKSASSSDNSYFTATASDYSSFANYNVQIGRIAQSQQIASSSFASKDGPVADLSIYSSQKLRLQIGSKSPEEITIDSSNNSLEGIRDAINNAKIGINATVSTFDITSSNNTIKFKVGVSDYTARIDEGYYSGDQLASKVKEALTNAYNKGGGNFAVSYDGTSNTFKINNTTGNQVDVLWDDPSTTAAPMLGFDAGTSTIQDKSSVESSTGAAISGYRLVLDSTSTGKDNKIIIDADTNGNDVFGEDSEGETSNSGLGQLAFNPTYDGSNNVSGGVANMTQSKSAQDAIFKINGKEHTSSINNVSSLVLGVTLNLLKADPGYNTNPKDLRLSVYPMSLESSLKAFVSSFNISADLMDKQKGNSEEPGVLADDAMMNSLDSDLRNLFNASGSVLSSIGMSYTAKGRLEINDVRFKALISEDAGAVTNSVRYLSSRLYSKISRYIDNEIPRQQATYEDSIKDIQKQEQRVKAQLKIKQMMVVGNDNPLNDLLNQPVNKEGGMLGLLSSYADRYKK